MDASIYAHIAKEAKRHNLDLALVHRVIQEESGWRSRPGKTGDYGLMQVRLPTARDILDDSLITPQMLLEDHFLNTTAGIKYLAWCRDKWKGNMRLALASYNRGIGRVKNDLREGKNPVNKYVNRVLGQSSLMGHVELTRQTTFA